MYRKASKQEKQESWMNFAATPVITGNMPLNAQPLAENMETLRGGRSNHPDHGNPETPDRTYAAPLKRDKSTFLGLDIGN